MKRASIAALFFLPLVFLSGPASASLVSPRPVASPTTAGAVGDLVCPPGALSEGEPACQDGYVDTYNGGCNLPQGSGPDLSSCQISPLTVCGLFGTYVTGGVSHRDQDWYHLALTQPQHLHCAVVAQVGVQLSILNGNGGCPNAYTVSETSAPAAGDSAVCDVTLGTGTYWVCIQPVAAQGVPCGSAYVLQLSASSYSLAWPAGASMEGEPEVGDGYQDTFNGGCTAAQPAFSPLPCGTGTMQVGGTYGTYVYNGNEAHDTDWYQLDIAQTSVVHACVIGEAQTELDLIDGRGGCAGRNLLAGPAVAVPGQSACCDATLQPGTYWIYVAPADPAGVSPASRYVLSVSGYACPAACALPPQAVRGGGLYGSSSGGSLFRLNLQTGAGTFVGTLPGPGCTEIVYDSLNCRAFAQGADGSYLLRAFLPSTGVAAGPSVNDGATFTGLEYVGGTLYGTAVATSCGPSTLRMLDPMSGASTVIGPTGYGPISGLAYDPSAGVMYGVTGCEGTSSTLLTLNLATGAATPVGSVGFVAGSIEFGPDGRLYAGAANAGGGVLYRLDPATGASTVVGPSGFGGITGLARIGAPPFATVTASTNRTVNPGGGYAMTFKVCNTGSCADSFLCGLEDSQGWLAAAESKTIYLAPGQCYTQVANVVVPRQCAYTTECLNWICGPKSGGTSSAQTLLLCAGTTAVAVSDLTATPEREGGVEVRWNGFLEGAAARYQVLRSVSADGAYVSLGEVEGGAGRGEFAFRDASAAFGTRYFYKVAWREGEGSWSASSPVESAPLAARFAIRAIRPNPTGGETRIDYELARTGNAELEIYDVAGRRVRSLLSGMAEAGPATAAWDGRGEGGRALSAGTYFARLTSAGRKVAQKILLVR